MNVFHIGNHKELQNMSNLLAGCFIVEDPFVLRSAITEGIQNTIQHSDGNFCLKIEPELIIIVNQIKENNHPKNGIGLELFKGIKTYQKGGLFYTFIFPQKVRLKPINVDRIMQA